MNIQKSIEEFRTEIKNARMIRVPYICEKYRNLWKGYPSLVNEYLSMEKMFGYVFASQLNEDIHA